MRIKNPPDLSTGQFISSVPVAQAPPSRAHLIGRCPAVLYMLKLCDVIAPYPEVVLVTGETGTGKSALTRYIHEKSGRDPLIMVNCSTIPHDLTESELFGHVAGAFTGARGPKDGLFLAANGGTLVLDEIGDLPPDIQTKLLTVLQEGTIRPVGAVKDLKVNVRVIAATNRDLSLLIREGRFRQDLYFRLTELEVFVPPLRDRGLDIIEIALDYLHGRFGSDVSFRFTEGAVARMLELPWKGNIRELRQMMLRLVNHRAMTSVSLDMPITRRELDALLGLRVVTLRKRVDERKSEVLRLFEEQSQCVATRDICRELNISPSTAKKVTNLLVGEQLIYERGKGRGTRYGLQSDLPEAPRWDGASEEERKVLELVLEAGAVGRQEVAAKLKVAGRTATRLLTRLLEAGWLEKDEQSRYPRYRLTPGG